MNIRLKPDTEEWLKAQVAEGRFESIEDAVEALVAEHQITQAELDASDLSWAKPYIDEGLAAIEAGDLVPAEEVHRELLARLKRPSRT
jgi:predicted transcriptional regulator